MPEPSPRGHAGDAVSGFLLSYISQERKRVIYKVSWLADHTFDKIYSIKYFCNTEVPGLGSEKIFDCNIVLPSFGEWYREITSTESEIITLAHEIKVIVLLKCSFHIAIMPETQGYVEQYPSDRTEL